jgi:nucleoside-diphosphate-sugar epimerase
MNELQRLTGSPVVVLGGTGFVGARLVERLVRGYGARVRVLVRDFATAARIARLPIELVRGDVRDRASVARAAEGCAVMFHCAFGNWRTDDDQRDITVTGTDAALSGAADARVARMVYVSTLSVYGLAADGPLDESSPRRPSGTAYADAKLEAEQLADAHIRRGLPLSIIQPTVIYGPYGPNWTIEPIRRLRGDGQILIDEGQGYCNAVFVDDLVSALMLAAVRSEAIGQTFLISGSQPVTWAEFIHGYSEMLDAGGKVISMTRDQALAAWQASRRSYHLPQFALDMLRLPGVLPALVRVPEFRLMLRATKSVLPRRAWAGLKHRAGRAEVKHYAVPPRAAAAPTPIGPADIALFAAKQVVRIDKAQRLLGYRPQHSLAAGMAVTERWARWSRLLHSSTHRSLESP